MADYVCDECPELVCGIFYIKVYRRMGKPALAKDRAYAKLERNYFLQEDLAGKEVILVDDIFTTGSSLQDFRKQVETTGGTVTGAIFATETFKMPGKFSCCLNALCWSEPEKETRENDTSVLCGSDSSHGDKRDEKPDGLDITKGKCRSERGSHRNAKSEVPEEDNWMPDRTIMHGDEMINLYYGIRGGKRAVVKKEVFPLEGEKGKNGEDGLKEFDIRI